MAISDANQLSMQEDEKIEKYDILVDKLSQIYKLNRQLRSHWRCPQEELLQRDSNATLGRLPAELYALCTVESDETVDRPGN